MQAVVYKRYGSPDVFQLVEMEKPVPKDNEILVGVVATTVRTGDWRMRKADPWMARLFNGLFRPRRVTVLGMELAGDVEAVGRKVTIFRPGDKVFASTGLKFGAYADYCTLPEDAVVAIKPDGVSYIEAAAAPSGGIAALALLKKGQIQRGQKVLVYGASGSVGSFAVQLARHLGAHVTGVCSGANAEWVQALGAERVVDYTREDVTALDERYDLIVDAVGKMISGHSKGAFKRILAPGGRVVCIEDSYKETVDALRELAGLMERGAVKAVIDRRYSLAQMAEAHRYVEQGHKKGNVVVVVDPHADESS